MEVAQLRETERPEDIFHELMQDCDSAVQVDCADPHANFIVAGWFVFPEGSLLTSPTVTSPT